MSSWIFSSGLSVDRCDMLAAEVQFVLNESRFAHVMMTHLLFEVGASAR